MLHTDFEVGTLSLRLTALLEESKKLLELKAEFGRLPQGAFRRYCEKLINQWFNEIGEQPHVLRPNERPTDSTQTLDAGGRESLARLQELATEERFRASSETVPDEDSIPF